MRGANLDPTLQLKSNAGSSPHARGKRGKLKISLIGFRIIPACAGQTLKIYYLKTVNYKRHKNYQIYRYKNYSSYVYLKFRNTISNNPRVRGKL